MGIFCGGAFLGLAIGVAFMFFNPLWLIQTINLLRGKWDE